MLNPQRLCKTYIAGEVPYTLAWQWQRSLVQQCQQSPTQPDVLILLEHPPVYTLGQGSDLSFVKFDPVQSQVEVHRIERGGEVTYHCPGQLVGYPILDLHRHQRDLHWYLRQLEEVLILTLANFGLQGERIAGLTGVWIDGVKVGAIGIKVSRWVTMHGFSLNVCPKLEGFRQIVPCGIADRPVGSIAQWLPETTVEQVRPHLMQAFASVFDLTLEPAALSELDSIRSPEPLLPPLRNDITSTPTSDA